MHFWRSFLLYGIYIFHGFDRRNSFNKAILNSTLTTTEVKVCITEKCGIILHKGIKRYISLVCHHTFKLHILQLFIKHNFSCLRKDITKVLWYDITNYIFRSCLVKKELGKYLLQISTKNLMPVKRFLVCQAIVLLNLI